MLDRHYSRAAVLAVALSLSLAGCDGGARNGARPENVGATAAATNFSTHRNDRDNDGDHNDDDEKILYFGHAADLADRRSSIALVTRYFAAAAAGNGAAGCSMLAPFVAEKVVENDGHSPGLLGSTCAVVLSKLFELHQRPLAKKKAALRVIGVRVEGDRALVILDFPEIPEVRKLTERRVGGAWTLLDLLDGIVE